MALSTTTNKATQNGNGSNDTFPYAFLVLDETHLVVTLTDLDGGNPVVQTLTTHYSVTGVGNPGGGNVVFVTPPTAAQRVVIERLVPQTQLVDYVENDPFPADTHEQALDLLTMVVQQQQAQLDRSISFPATSTATNTVLDPGPAANRGKVIVAASDGSGFDFLTIGLSSEMSVLGAKGDLATWDTKAAALAVGADNTLLVADSALAKGLGWKTLASYLALLATTKGDLMVRDSTDVKRLPVGANGQHLEADSSEALGMKWATPTAALRGYLDGYLTSLGTDALHDIDIGAGLAASDDASRVWMERTSTITKQLDAAWAEGTNQGGNNNLLNSGITLTFNDNGGSPDDITATSGTPFASVVAGDQIIITGSTSNNGVWTVTAYVSDTVVQVATGSFTQEGPVSANAYGLHINKTYHLWVAMRMDTGVVDALFDLSATSPTLPPGYTKKHLVGSILTDGSADIVPYVQDDDLFRLDVMVSSYNTTNPGTSRITVSMFVPTGLSVKVWAAYAISDTNVSSTQQKGLITHPDQTDTVPSNTIYTLRFNDGSTASGGNSVLGYFPTNTLGQICHRQAHSDASVTTTLVTYGWLHPRGKE